MGRRGGTDGAEGGGNARYSAATPSGFAVFDRPMLTLWKLARKHLDLELATSREIRTRIVERPGLWMADDELRALVGDLRAIARATLGDRELDYGVLTGDPERLSRAVVTLLHDRSSGRPVAFNALSILPVRLRGRDEEVLHLGLVMVDPGHRGRGMSWVLYGLTCMLLLFRNQLRPIWVSNVTQVPAIVGMVSESFADVFPRPEGEGRRSHDHLVLARQIMARHRRAFGVGPEAGFDYDRFVISDAYTGGSDHLKKTFDEAPQHRDPRYGEMCRAALDYGRGDDFLQLGRVSLGSARRYLLRSVPPRSVPAVAASYLFAFLGSIVLPIVHWLSPGKPMGELRPWRE